MNPKNLFKVCAIAALVGSSLVNAHAELTAVTVDINYSTETNGRLQGTVTFDDACTKKTVTKIRCVVSYDTETGQVAERLVLSKNLKKNRTSFNFNVAGLNAVRDSNDNNDAVLSCQARTKCDGEDIDSNVAAAFVNCGKGVKEVAPKAFLTTLKQKLTPS